MKLRAIKWVGVFLLVGAVAAGAQARFAAGGATGTAALRSGAPGLAASGQTGGGATSYDSVTGDDVVGMLREMGFTPELTKDSDGDPLVNFQIEGVKTSIYFYENSGGRYSAIQFYSGFEDQPPISKVNDWNANHRYGRAYLSSAGKLHIEYDIALTGGISRDNLEECVRRWHTVLSAFAAFFA